MGNPHGHALDGTPVITLGVLSGKGRAAAETGYLYVDSLQTDAEINPGNSGGPLFDVRGKLIGINGLMRSTAGRSNSGVGFAIPIDQVRLFLGKLLKDEGGGVGYGFHGLQIGRGGTDEGASVSRVERASPAEKAGLRKGDVIYRVNRKKVSNRSDFVNIVGKLPEGAGVSVSYRRGRRPKSARFRLVPYADYLKSVGRTPQRKRALKPHERGYLGFEYRPSDGFMMVTKVMPGTGAEKLRLKEGDLVTALDTQSTADFAAVWKYLADKAADEVVILEVKRGSSRKRMKLVLCDASGAAGFDE